MGGTNEVQWDRRALDADWKKRIEGRLSTIGDKVDELYAEKQRQLGRRELYSDIARWTSWMVGALALIAVVAKALGYGV